MRKPKPGEIWKYKVAFPNLHILIVRYLPNEDRVQYLTLGFVNTFAKEAFLKLEEWRWYPKIWGRIYWESVSAIAFVQ